MSNNQQEDWSMIYVIKIPPKYCLGTDYRGRKTVHSIEYRFSYLEERNCIELECTVVPVSARDLAGRSSRLFLINEIKQYLEESIQTQKPIYEHEEFSTFVQELTEQVVRKGINNDPVQLFDIDYTFDDGDGLVHFGDSLNDTIACESLSYRLSIDSATLRRTPEWNVNGTITGCDLDNYKSLIAIGQDLSVSFLDYNQQANVLIDNASIVSIAEHKSADGTKTTWDICYVTDEAPICRAVGTADIRRMRIDKMRLSASAKTPTGQRILSIRINEELNEVRGSGKQESVPTLKSDTTIRNRFANILKA